MMDNKVKYIMLHCTATPEGIDYTLPEIKNWFTSRGWKYPGYHYITHLNGHITVLREPFNNLVSPSIIRAANGAKNWNNYTIHLAYIGGVERNDIKCAKDTRTKAQLKSLEAQIRFLLAKFPECQVLGHNQISSKECPSFNVSKWLRSLDIREENIFNKDVPHELCQGDSCSPFDLDHENLHYYQ